MKEFLMELYLLYGERSWPLSSINDSGREFEFYCDFELAGLTAYNKKQAEVMVFISPKGLEYIKNA